MMLLSDPYQRRAWSAETYVGLEGLQDHGGAYVFPPPHRSHDTG